MHKKLILLSTFIYSLAINCAFLCWPLIIFFPIPLFIIALKKQLTFLNGFLWGIIFFSINLHDIAHTVFIMGEGPQILRIIPGLFIIVYIAFYSALWFWCTQKIINIFKFKKTATIVFICTFTLWIYIYFIDHYALWLFNRIEGYPLVHPLLTLAHKPQLLTLLPILGKPLLTLLLLLISAILFLLLYTKNKRWLITFLLAVIPWIISPLLFKKKKPPSWINTIAYLPVIFTKGTSTPAMIDGAAYDIKKILFYKPHTTIIIMPESSFYSDDLCNHTQALHAWSKEQLGKKIHIFIGAFRKTKHNYYNCLYWIYNGKLKNYCDKHHAIPLIEKLPSWFAWSWLKNTYFCEYTQLTLSHKTRPFFNLRNCMVIPYICSELYFNQSLDDQHTNIPILFVSNDRWFSSAYVPELLLRIARLKALEWQRTIIYCSFVYQTLCLSTGELYQKT